MSRFDDLCESYKKLIRGAAEYEADCREFIRKVVTGFVDYLECGRNDLAIKHLSLEDDGFYHCIMELTVYESTATHSSRGLVPEVLLKIARDDNEFIVKPENSSQEFRITHEELKEKVGENTELFKLYETIFRGIKSYYETPIDYFIRKNMKGKISLG